MENDNMQTTVWDTQPTTAPLKFETFDAAMIPVGSAVEKIGGSYQATGTVVAAFRTLAGEPRYVFEFDSPKGMLHIFGPSQIQLRLR